MAATKWVKDQAKEGEMLVQKLLENHFDVTAACWVLQSEKEDWRLYIVSKTVAEKGYAEASEEHRKSFDQLPDLWMDLFDVMLVEPTDRVAQAIAAIQCRHPVRLKTRHHTKLGGMSSADVHVYPMPAQTSPVPGN